MSQNFPQKPNMAPKPSAGAGQAAAVAGGTAGIVIIVLAVVAVASLCVCGILVALLLPAVQAARQAARRTQSANNMKQIGLALHNYHDVYKAFPQGQNFPGEPKLHSWRTRILPFLEQSSVSDSVDWGQPWNTGSNQALLNRSIPVFESLNDEQLIPGNTSYVGISDKGTVFDPAKKGASFAKITDGTSNTIIAIEAPNSGIKWAEPRDVTIAEAIQIIRSAKIGTNVLYADGSVQYINPMALSDEQLRAHMTIDGGEATFR